MRHLQLWFLRSFRLGKDDQNMLLYPPPDVKSSLQWWTSIEALTISVPLSPPSPQLTLTTDASLWGWGAHLQDYCVGGQWPDTLRSRHINYLELFAIFLSLQRFQLHLQGRPVQIFSDNTTAVCYLNKQGGVVSRSLCHLAIRIWDFCAMHSITPVATHVPGEENTVADAISRGALSTHELSLPMATVQEVFDQWGRPQIDVFATAQNKKCHLFCTQGRADPRSLGDGLLLDWRGKFLYLFPPLPLIPRVIQKIRRERPRCVLITPWWPRRIWFPTLLLLSRHRYQFLNNVPETVINGLDIFRRLKLTAWLLD